MAKKKQEYGNESIVTLKGADRVRKRPAVIFGSDGIEGCQHSVFEILSNSIDEAREGYGNKIIVTRYEDKSVEIEDFGRGIPVDYNKMRNALTGSLFSASFMPAVNSIIMMRKVMSFLLDLTVWDFVQRNIPPNIWM